VTTPGVRHVAAGFGWQAFTSYSNRLFGFITTLILAKVLTPEHFGLVGIASMLLEMLQILKDMGISEALIAHKRDDQETIDTAHVILVGFNTLLFLLAVIASPFAARFYDNSLVMPVIIVMSSNLIWDSLRSVPRTLVRKNIEFRQLVIPEVVPVFVTCAVSIVMALTGFGVWSLVAKTVLHSLMGLVLVRRLIPYRPRFRFHAEAARDLAQYGKFIIGATIVFVVLYNIDRFYVSKVEGLAALGLFELARTLAELPVKQFSFLVGSVMFPVFSKMNRAGTGVQAAFVKTLKYTAYVSVPMAVGLSVFGPPLVANLYGARWAGMIEPLRILSLYAAFRSLGSLIHDMLKATGRPHLVLRFAVYKLVCIGALGLPALMWQGLSGICWLILATYASGFLWELRTGTRVLGVPFGSTLLMVVRILLVALVCIGGGYALLTWGLGTLATWQLVVGIGLTGSAYALALTAMDREGMRDARMLLRSRTAS
jgi:O-antigen/teichoic acid export membrane protein